MSDSLGERLAKIGAKTPMEIFEECVTLHGEMIAHVHNRSKEDFEAIVDDIKIFISQHDHLLLSYDVAAFKNMLNRRVSKGIQTVGNYKELESIAVKDNVVAKSKAEEKKEQEEDTKVCSECDLPLPLDRFPNVKGGKKGRMCKHCRGEKISQGHNKTKPYKEDKPESTPEESDKPKDFKEASFEEELKKLREENSKLSTKLIEKEIEMQGLMTEEEWLAQQKTDEGLYFISAILKDPDTGELSNSIDQIYSTCAECAVGEFTLSEDVKDQIIISLSYVKSVEKEVHH